MRDKWQLSEAQLKELLLVTHVVIGAEITEESKDEASACFDREGTEDVNQQHEVDPASAQKHADDNA